jgi:hypothetical protein
MTNDQPIIRLFEKFLGENQLSLTNQQKDVYTSIVNLAGNADNLNSNDLNLIRKMTLKGYNENVTTL